LTEYTALTQVERQVDCPYCGETIEVLIDGSVERQDYIEDCQVCCCPIVFRVTVGVGDDVSIVVSGENE
jgi:hypothetical protein